MSKKIINIGKFANIDVNLEILIVNPSRKPRIAIVTGIHGNETSGLLIIHELLQRIQSLKGQLSIVAFSNPIATLMGRRVGTDFLDLNRVFPGKKNGTITERIAWKLSRFLLKQDFVIDLHTFDVITPIMGIFMDTGSEKVRKRSLEMLEVFSPDVIWNLKPVKGKEKIFFSALGPFLARNGIPNFAVEMNQLEILTNREIEKVVNGILNVFNKLDSGEEKHELKRVLIVDRKEFRSEKTGVFIPLLLPLNTIRKGQIIGRIINVEKFGSENVISPEDGILIQISPKRFVKTGDLLFSIGKEIRALGR